MSSKGVKIFLSVGGLLAVAAIAFCGIRWIAKSPDPASPFVVSDGKSPEQVPSQSGVDPFGVDPKSDAALDVPLAVVPGADGHSRPALNVGTVDLGGHPNAARGVTLASQSDVTKSRPPDPAPTISVGDAGAAQGAPDAMAIAMRPSLKYGTASWGTVGDTSTPAASAALAVPLVSIGRVSSSIAPSAPSSKSNPQSSVDISAEHRRLIESALKLEQDRRFTMSMCQDLQGCLWVGTEGGGVQRFDPSAPELKQWTEFTTKDGLGDDNGYAIACDHQGRIWVGHLNHGVSVYNGQKWQNYEVVGGISSPTSLSGPLGERIFAIKVCPTDGDVWMASSCGLARYSETEKTWSYYTRAEGLPSDQAQALAFGSEGDIYVGTQCDGIAIARASDAYKKWQVTTGPDKLPTEPTGNGLPTNLINDMLVVRDGTVYAATTAGLAWSKDKGATWQFVRGQDWADKVRGLYGGPPSGWHAQHGAWLAEDFITALAEDEHGSLWVGYREHGLQLIDIFHSRILKVVDGASYVTSLLNIGPESVFLGTYEDRVPRLSSGTIIASPASKCIDADLPPGAQAPGVAELDAMTVRVSVTQTASDPTATYIGEDWATQGDWVGRYGRQHNILCGAMSPYDQQLIWDNIHQIHGQMGPNHAPNDCLRAWIGAIKTDDHRILYDPIEGVRRQSEWDDHGEAYPETQDGPDVWVSIQVPSGIQRVSLYFANNDGHGGGGHGGFERARDYLVEVFDDSVKLEDPYSSKPLASCRVKDFWGGVYKQFLVQGPGNYRIRIARNASANTILSAVFVDKMAGPKTQYDSLAMAWMGGHNFQAPEITEVSKEGLGYAALKLWLGLDDGYNQAANWVMEIPERRIAYRVARENKSPSSLLDNWRWNVALWSEFDRHEFANVMDQAWSEQIKWCPGMVWEKRIPLHKDQ